MNTYNKKQAHCFDFNMPAVSSVELLFITMSTTLYCVQGVYSTSVSVQRLFLVQDRKF